MHYSGFYKFYITIATVHLFATTIMSYNGKVFFRFNDQKSAVDQDIRIFN